MISKICAIYDGKAEAYSQPMFFQSTGQAVRSFGDECNRSDSNIGMHPEDYTLFLLGEWNERDGTIVLETAPVALGQAIHLVREEVA